MNLSQSNVNLFTSPVTHLTILHVYTKLYPNQPRFAEDMTKTFWHTYFWDTVYMIRNAS